MTKILHVIDSLQLGGAEKQLLKVIECLPEFEHVIVLLKPMVYLEDLMSQCKTMTLNHSNMFFLPLSVIKLKKIIREEKPDIVWSNLYWSSLVTRLACPPRTKCYFSVHSVLSNDAFKRSIYVWLERLTYKARHHIICVSETVMNDYKKRVEIKGPCDMLYNYIESDFFRNLESSIKLNELHMVAIGNLKEIKNYEYLLQAFKGLEGMPVYLDIYGDGKVRDKFQTFININKIKVNLKGKVNVNSEILAKYNLFVMPSLSEGCPTAVQEAMAMGLPLLLSDIPAMHEVSANNAIYFKLTDFSDFVIKVKNILNGAYNLKEMKMHAFNHASEYYSRKAYREKLLKILNEG
jgi:glycosyltransferase involved in cell wall biosynthesis